MSKDVNKSPKLLQAKYLLAELQKKELAIEEANMSGNEIPSTAIPLTQFIKDTGYNGKTKKLLDGNEVIKRLFRIHDDLIIPRLEGQDLTAFNAELNEQINMAEGSFRRVGLGEFKVVNSTRASLHGYKGSGKERP